jgi:hypothetical protein
VVPLLKALGWPEELIAVEYQGFDVALFRKLPRLSENLAFIIEGKRLGKGIEVFAVNQARNFLRSYKAEQAEIVVTDGQRYYIFNMEQSDHIAYANLSDLRKSASLLFDRLRRV